jgi:type IV secretion system protein VirD4
MTQKPIILLGQPLVKKNPSILDSDVFPAIYTNGEGNGNGHDKTNGKSASSKLNRTMTTARGEKPLTYKGDSHLMTIAPTGTGKGRSVIIPNLLTYTGPIVVVDPKGENYAVTARARREMGQKVVKLDPFGITQDGKSDSFNPFDILDFTKSSLNDEARLLADLVMVGAKSLKEPFWDNWASTVISGVVIYLAHLIADTETHKRSFVGVRDLLYGDDPTYKLAVLLDTKGKTMDAEAYQEISTFLSIRADVTRAGVLSTAQQYLRLFGSPTVQKAIEKTTFDLAKIRDGEPVSLYIIIPPNKLVSHQALFRLWVGALLSLYSSRESVPKINTLFIIDEAAQLGNLSLLRQAKTLLRGYGLQTWSFWQDLSQIKELYQTEWATMVNNCAVLQLFGAKNYMVAQEFASMVGADAEEIRKLKGDEQVLILDGERPIHALRYDYLRDEAFKGLYDANPLYDNLDES